jgi:hypothetical protein
MSADPQTLFDAPPREVSILEKHLRSGRYSPTHARGLETEVEAAKKAQERAPILREKVLAVLAAAGEFGATDYELSQELQVLRTTAGKRRGELVADGLVERTDKRRMTDTFTSAAVWKASEDGLRVAQQLQQEGRTE